MLPGGDVWLRSYLPVYKKESGYSRVLNYLTIDSHNKVRIIKSKATVGKMTMARCFASID
jgi:hypothetical protein